MIKKEDAYVSKARFLWILILLIFTSVMLTSCGGKDTSDEALVAQETKVGNPASVYCEAQKGKIEVRETVEGAEGICVFPDGSECEEWAFYYRECSSGSSEDAQDQLTIEIGKPSSSGSPEEREGEGEEETGIGYLKISTEPERAKIFVNGFVKGYTPDTLELQEGTHTLRLEKTSYKPYFTKFEIERGKTERIDFKMIEYSRTTEKEEELENLPDDAPATLIVDTFPPGGIVYIDGVEKGTAQITIKDISPGIHNIRIERTGFKDWEDDLKFKKGEEKSIEVVLERD